MFSFQSISISLVACSLIGCIVGTDPEETEEGEVPGPVVTSLAAGNGAPSGAHFTLNIIGRSATSANITSGNRIFVPLQGKTSINLQEGSFAVIDGNATDGSGTFRLPNPDPENDGTTTYSVFARALGKPGGSATQTTCFTDSTDTYRSVYSNVMVRSSGPSKFNNVTQALLYVYTDTDGDGRVERYPLFSDPMASYFWDYDNVGLKLAQLRFYEVPTTVAAP